MIEFIKDLWDFSRSKKKYWLIPLLVVLIIFGALVVFSQGTVIAPFIYTLF